MRKLINFIVTIIIIIIILVVVEEKILLQGEDDSMDTLYIYNWGDYIDESLIDKFSKEYGYKVVYETFDSNESMFIKVNEAATNYDIVIPSDYMIAQMIANDLLYPIDKSKIENYNAIDPMLLGKEFDVNNDYSIPYFWGTVGIVYNKKKLDEMGAPYPVCYNDLKNEEYENSILLSNSTREALTIGLAINGDSLNTMDENQLENAINELEKMSNNIKAIVGDEIKPMMVMNEAPISIGWSGDASYMKDLNSDLEYIIPCEGGNIWIDSMVIPKTAQNIDGAYDFINFMLDEENAQINADYVGYESVLKTIIDENRDDDTDFYPEEDIVYDLEAYSYVDENQMELYEEKFLDFKTSFK